MTRALENGDGQWVDERWTPVLVTAMSGTEFEGREIPLAWQIEFEPGEEEFETANESVVAAGLEVDGYGWGDFLRKKIQKRDRPLAKRLHLTDCEIETCVIWVESEEDCRAVVEMVWKVIFESSAP